MKHEAPSKKRKPNPKAAQKKLNAQLGKTKAVKGTSRRPPLSASIPPEMKAEEERRTLKAKSGYKPTGSPRGPKSAKTDADWEVFFTTLSKTANVTAACEAAGISRTVVYDRKLEDPEFSALWDKCYDRGWLALEELAQKRAFDGIQKPVFYKGRVVKTVTEYSDSLVQFLMKGRMRKIYGDKSEVTVTKNTAASRGEMSAEELDEAILKKLGVTK